MTILPARKAERVGTAREIFVQVDELGGARFAHPVY
jgi:hypothetical protein